MAGPLLFNTSFIIDPRGEIILKHWKHNHNAFLLPYTSPCDVYDEFIRRYCRKAPFPVVDTPLGRLGCLTCCECMFPELARCTVFNGAEVILHPTSEFQDQITETTDFLKIARAVDTVSYWVSANIGEYANAARGAGDPTFGWISPSKVWTKLELCANAISGKTTSPECGQSPPVTWIRTW